MIDKQTEKRFFHFVLWLFAACVIVILMTSCSPLAMYAQPATTTTPKPTATILSIKSLPSPTAQTCIVSTGIPRGYLNFRTGPGVNYSVIRVLAEGESITVIARGDWLKVTTRENLTGYIYSKFCK